MVYNSVTIVIIIIFTITGFYSSAHKSKHLHKHFKQFMTAFDAKSLKKLIPLAAVIKKNPNIKYILQWTSADHVPFLFMGVGRQGFIDRNCSYTNCYVTSFKHLLGDYTKFDVIAFSGPDVRQYSNLMLPSRRSPRQKYVFASTESSEIYPVFLKKFDGYFNWTWTYKLDSDLRWGFIVIRDMKGNVVGPKENINWIETENMNNVTDELKKILRGKKKAVAWFSSICDTPSNRERRIRELASVLRTKYGLDLDIYGDCGSFSCLVDDIEECNKKIRSDYFFYLAFEQSISEDYVTEELLRAVQYNAVPIVFGGADYSRFLPSGSYLDAAQANGEELADQIHDLIRNPRLYEEFFKWTNHYKYSSTLDHKDTNEYCKMCALLNDESKFNQISVYNKLRNWWNPYEYRPQYKTSGSKTTEAKTNMSVIETIFDFSNSNNKIGDVTRFSSLHSLFPLMKSIFK